MLSAIMSAYNVEAYVEPAILSIIAQTYQDWELIVVDDGSTDRTHECCLMAAGSDPRVRILEYPHGGRASALNRCLQNACGEILIMCDADDIYFPDTFEYHWRRFADNRDLAISCACRNVVFSDSLAVSRMYYLEFPSNPTEIKRKFSENRMAISNCGSAIARWVFERYGVYDVRLLRCQDYHFFRRCIVDVEICGSDRPLIMMRSNRRVGAWGYFWLSKKYHRWADRLLARGGEDGSEAETSEPPSLGTLSTGLGFLQFGKCVLSEIVSRKRGLTDEDSRRVVEVLSTGSNRRLGLTGDLNTEG